MIIGTDISLSVCKAEGYLMIEFNGRKKFDRKEYYRVFAHAPDYLDLDNKIILDTLVSFDDLKEVYDRFAEDLNSFAETSTHVDFEKPTINDLLSLACDINSYTGLE